MSLKNPQLILERTNAESAQYSFNGGLPSAIQWFKRHRSTLITIEGCQYQSINGQFVLKQGIPNFDSIESFNYAKTLVSFGGSVNRPQQIMINGVIGLYNGSSWIQNGNTFSSLVDAGSAADWYTKYGKAPIVVDGVTYVSNGSSFVVPRQKNQSTIGFIREIGAVDSFALTNHTFQTNYLLPRKPYALQFIFYGHDAASVPSCKAAYAFSSDATSTGAASLQLSSVNTITFDGASTFTLPARVSSASAINTELGIIVSDLMVVNQSQLVARNDGKSGYILAIREFIAGAVNATRTTVAGTDTKSFDENGNVKYGYKNGDAIATPGTTMTSGAIGAACAVIAYYEEPLRTIIAVGDSTIQGFSASAITYNYGASRYYSVAKYASGNPVNVFSIANPGQDSKTYLKNFLQNIKHIDGATDCVFSPFSINDNGGIYNANIFYSNVVSNCNLAIKELRKNEINPILITPHPVNGYSAATETIRRECARLIRSIATANNCAVIDRDAVLADYSTSTGGYKSGLNDADGIHPSAAGFLTESAEWMKVLG